MNTAELLRALYESGNCGSLKIVRRLKVVAIFCTILLACLAASTSSAQEFSIRVLNAKSGKPLKNKMITVGWDENWPGTELTLDGDGKANVPIPSGAKNFTLREGPNTGNEPYRIAYLDCNQQPLSRIEVAVVLKSGFVPGNKCGKISASAHPGEIVFWGLLRPWWVPDFQ